MSEKNENSAGEFAWKLVVPDGPNSGKSYILFEGNNLVGRWDTDHGSFPEINLEEEDPDAKISRKHAVIDCKKGEVTVEDLESLNGTFINSGQQLKAGVPHKLKNGDILTFAGTNLKLESSKMEDS